MLIIIPEHSDTLRKGHRCQAFLSCIRPADGVEQVPVPPYLLPGKENGVPGIIDMRWFAACAIQLDDRKCLTFLQFLPAAEFDVQPAKIKSGYPAADIIDGRLQPGIDPMTTIQEFRPSAVIAVWRQRACFADREHPVQRPAIGTP